MMLFYYVHWGVYFILCLICLYGSYYLAFVVSVVDLWGFLINVRDYAAEEEESIPLLMTTTTSAKTTPMLQKEKGVVVIDTGNAWEIL
mmetsp:Transcript_30975/g.35294  ORF Transcript_30975/g.35294 Transcript_30975/m.35294 type:complete len:88 (-) Transcript_30975:168-431(-)